MTEQEILSQIGQLESSIAKIEKYLNKEEFKDYCDSIYSSIAYWRIILKNIKDGS